MNKDLEELFRLIRKEKVVLWIGSGCSTLAGFPSVQQLISKIENKLDESQLIELKTISKSYDLQKISEEFSERYKNRKELLKIIIDNYSIQNVSNTKYHKILANIPFIKTIITTNYDTLLEEVYSNKCFVIRDTCDIVSKNNNELVEIFKIHGDIINPDKIIITETDYLNFLAYEIDKTYINIIKERLANNTVVFIGYSLEDINIKLLFKKLEIKNKKSYFLSPNVLEKQIPKKQSEITYIKINFEEFTTNLLKNIQDNIFIEKISDNNLNPVTLSKFLNQHDITTSFKGVDKKFILEGLNFSKKPKIEFITDNEELKSKFDLFLKGENEVLDLLKNEAIDFELKINEISLLNQNTSLDIQFRKREDHIGLLALKINSELISENIKYRCFIFENKTTIEFDLNSISIKITFDRNDIKKIKIDFKLSEYCKNIYDEISIFKLLKKISGSEDLILSSNVLGEIKIKAINNIEFLKICSAYLDYLKKLELIEDYFDFSFENFLRDDVTLDSFNKIAHIIDIINKENRIVNLTEIWEADLDKSLKSKSIKELKSELNNQPITIETLIDKTIFFHNIKIRITGKLKYIINDPIISYKKNKGRIDIKFKSKSQKATIDFTELLLSKRS